MTDEKIIEELKREIKSYAFWNNQNEKVLQETRKQLIEVLKQNEQIAKKTREESMQEIKALRSNVSQLQKKLNVTILYANNYRKANDFKKQRLRQFSILCDFLLKYKRVTREELKRFLPRAKLKENEEKKEK